MDAGTTLDQIHVSMRQLRGRLRGSRRRLTTSFRHLLQQCLRLRFRARRALSIETEAIPSTCQRWLCKRARARAREETERERERESARVKERGGIRTFCPPDSEKSTCTMGPMSSTMRFWSTTPTDVLLLMSHTFWCSSMSSKVRAVAADSGAGEGDGGSTAVAMTQTCGAGETDCARIVGASAAGGSPSPSIDFESGCVLAGRVIGLT